MALGTRHHDCVNILNKIEKILGQVVFWFGQVDFRIGCPKDNQF